MRISLALVLVATACTNEATHVDPDANAPVDTGQRMDVGSDVPSDLVDLGPDSGLSDVATADLDQQVDQQVDSVAPSCSTPADCDDGRDCTTDHCEDGACFTTPAFDCDWPAELSDQAANLTPIEGPLINDLHTDLSGAVWNPTTRMLWVCRNTSGDSKIWAIDEDPAMGSFKIAYKGGERGEWSDFGDLEGLTLGDYAEPETLYLIVEGENKVVEVDLSTYGTAITKNVWATGSEMPAAGNTGAEGITFVPDNLLQQGGFVDADGLPYVSKNGMGGIMLVGHQAGGAVYAFDLNRTNGSFDFVGSYKTTGAETAALELDRSSGLLYIWHGEGINTLEIARLSSQLVDGERLLDAAIIFKGPLKPLFGSDNYEGLAVMTDAECVDSHRGLFLTIDGGNFWSLLWYRQFPCGF